MHSTVARKHPQPANDPSKLHNKSDSHINDNNYPTFKLPFSSALLANLFPHKWLTTGCYIKFFHHLPIRAIKVPYNLVYKAHFFSRRKKAKVGGAPYTRVQQNRTFIFSVIRSRMLPRFISDAKDKHPTFIFTVIRSGMLPRFHFRC